MQSTKDHREWQNDAWILHFGARLPFELLKAAQPELYADLISEYRPQLSSVNSQRVFDFLVDEYRARATIEDENFYRTAMELRHRALQESGREDG